MGLRLGVLLLFTLFTLAFGTGGAIADQYPSKPIRMIVPFPPGGSTDIVARLVSARLAERVKQPVVVENRAGVGGTLGSDFAAKAPADGYTLLLGTNATLAIAVGMYSKLPYHPLRDFTPISLVATSPSVLVVHPSVPANSVQQLINYAKANPGKLTFGSAGNGSSAHLCGEMFKTAASVDMVHVPYKGGAPAVSDLVGGQITVMFAGLAETLAHVRAGKLRALAVTSARRTATEPTLPTIAESGLPDYEFNQWFGVLAPAGTPREVVRQLNAALLAIMEMPEVRDRLLGQGLEAVSSTPEQFGAYIKSEMNKMVQVVKASGARVD